MIGSITMRIVLLVFGWLAVGACVIGCGGAQPNKT